MCDRIGKIVSALLLICLVAACNESLRPVEKGALNGPPGLTLDTVTEAIKQAGTQRGWKMTAVEPGKIDAELNVANKHYVKVFIEHDTKGYAISYRDSKNMGYNGVSIHWKYHDWVNNLKRAIKKEMERLS